ncbi:MAG TPA: hypothetical protein VF168_07235 [Trueperaceae bacterium]
MREKIIDIALIVTLIIVAFGITWTLLTLNRDEARPVDRDPPTRESDDSQSRAGISPIPIDPISPEEIEGPSASAEEAESRPDPEPQPQEQQARVADPEPVPPGPVRLERIGFSFVTGGAGACGIVLEPWRHIAVSRELLSAYGCGAEVTLSLDDEKGGHQEVEAIIGDTMNPSFSRTVNIYVAQDEPAFQYGITTGVLRP